MRRPQRGMNPPQWPVIGKLIFDYISNRSKLLAVSYNPHLRYHGRQGLQCLLE